MKQLIAALLLTLCAHAQMTPEEENTLETNLVAQLTQLALVTPRLLTNNLDRYAYTNLDYAMTIGIARTPRGRLWNCWVAGEDGPRAYFVLNHSDDNGLTWSDPALVIDMHQNSPIPRSTLIGNLWTAPDGTLHLFLNQSMLQFDGRSGDWVTVCADPDAPNPTWTRPRRIWHGHTLNKPTLLSDGSWLLPVSLNQRTSGGYAGMGKNSFGPYKDAFKELDPVRGANVFRSTDGGTNWTRLSCVKFPNPCWDEHMFVELKDHRIWMLARTSKGICQAFSSDQGLTWTEPTYPDQIKQPAARFHIRRLASGRLLLVKHGDTVGATDGTRSKLKAFLSEDDGQTWIGGLMLEERKGCTYPDGFQAPDGTIYISYDLNRGPRARIVLARFTEADILAGKLVTPTSKLDLTAVQAHPRRK